MSLSEEKSYELVKHVCGLFCVFCNLNVSSLEVKLNICLLETKTELPEQVKLCKSVVPLSVTVIVAVEFLV
jgi:hypothetical protein